MPRESPIFEHGKVRRARGSVPVYARDMDEAIEMLRSKIDIEWKRLDEAIKNDDQHKAVGAALFLVGHADALDTIYWYFEADLHARDYPHEMRDRTWGKLFDYLDARQREYCRAKE